MHKSYQGEIERKMKIFVSGQKSFGSSVFQMLIKHGHEITGVAAPRFQLNGADDKLFALANAMDVPVTQSQSLTADHIPDGTDLIVSAHSHAYIGRRTRDAARLAAIGYHPSLLPRHRGRDAIRWAIKMNDPIAGGTVFWLNNNVDAGDIAAQEWCWIEPGVTASELWRKTLFPLGLILLARVIGNLEAGTIVRIPQNEAVSTWEPAIDPPRMFRPELERLTDGSRGVCYQVQSDVDREIEALAI
jgi:methionyl-tRNA formyltransferase